MQLQIIMHELSTNCKFLENCCTPFPSVWIFVVIVFHLISHVKNKAAFSFHKSSWCAHCAN